MRGPPADVWAQISVMPPVAHAMKVAERDRWVRFHSLPEAKRYPDDAQEYEEVLNRADTLIGTASGEAGELMLVTAIHGTPNAVPERDQNQLEVQPEADYWREANVDPDEADWPLHLWTSWLTYTPHCLDPLIRLTADWQLTEVLIVAPERSIALHPYDGGMDILLPSPEERSIWHQRFSAWASHVPSGL